MTFISTPFAASSLAEVGSMVAPDCLTTLLLAMLFVQPESGVEAISRAWRAALPPTLQCSGGVSLEEDWKTTGLQRPVLPLRCGAMMLHLCLTTFALAGLGEREVSLDDDGELLVGEGAGVPACLPLLFSSFVLPLPLLPLALPPLPPCLVALLWNFGCWLSQWFWDWHIEHFTLLLHASRK